MTIAIPELAAAFMLAFARVGTLVMLLPAIGERLVPARLRLALALLLTLALFPLVSGLYGDLREPERLIRTLLGELAAGFVLGLSARMLVAGLQVAGSIVAQELGLSFVMTIDPTQGASQEATIGNFLSLLAVTLIFAADVHHLAVAAVRDSYEMMPPAGFPDPAEAARLATGALRQGFVLALKLSAPFVVFGFLFNLGLGILSRLMPQMQVFFLAMPLTILIGIAILFAVLTVMMSLYVGEVGHFLSAWSAR